MSQVAVFVDDVGVCEHAVAGAARVGDDPVAGATVFERQTHPGRQPLVHRALVVGFFMVGFGAVDEVPHVVAVDPVSENWSMSTSPSRSATATT